MRTWALLALGLLLGLMLGLVYTWVIAPPQYDDTYPPLMQANFREDWIRMTALAYGADGNLARAQLRLLDLEQAEIRQVLLEVLDDAAAAGQPLLLLRRLAELAQAYGGNSPAVRIYTQSTEVAPSPTATPTTPTATPPPASPTPSDTPTLSASPTSAATPPPQFISPYQIISQTFLCAEQPQLAITLLASQTMEVRGQEQVEYVPLPGQAVWLLWDDGADRALTGFKPGQGLGYADFEIAPGRVYKLYIDTPTGVPLSTVQVAPCTPDEGGGWIKREFVVLVQAP